MRRKMALGLGMLAVFFLSMTSFTGLDPAKGFFLSDSVDYLPAFLTFAWCAMLLDRKPLAIAAVAFLSFNYLILCFHFGYPSPGVTAAFAVAVAFRIRKSYQKVSAS